MVGNKEVFQNQGNIFADNNSNDGLGSGSGGGATDAFAGLFGNTPSTDGREKESIELDEITDEEKDENLCDIPKVEAY